MQGRGFAGFCRLFTLAALAGSTVLGGGGCLLFTDDFNKAPRVRVVGPDAVFRGESKRFTAAVEDEDGDAGLEWVVAEGDCPATLADADTIRRESRSFGNKPSFDLPQIGKAGASCVIVIVTDRAGARSFATKRIDVKERQLVVHRPATVTRSLAAEFRASFVDAEGKDDPGATEKSTFAWGRDATCENADLQARKTPGQKAFSTWKIDSAPRRPFCVRVVAKDENNVEAIGEVLIPFVVNNGPAAEIHMRSPAVQATTQPMATPPTVMGLFTTVIVSGAEPGDVLPEEVGNYVWMLTRPGGLAATMTGPDFTFTTETAGKYKVDLAVTEEGKTATATPLELTVEDQAPCIRETEPSFATAPRLLSRYDQPRVFRVIDVADDADPVPATVRESQGLFVWKTRLIAPVMEDWVGRPGGLPELQVPARRFQPGDRVEVRVDYLDRRDRVQPRDLSHCKDNEPRCAVVPAVECFQRITWTVDVQ